MDNNRGRYYQELLNLSYSDGVRVDQKASRVIAGNLIKDYFESDDNQSAADLKYTKRLVVVFRYCLILVKIYNSQY
jgi:hypothetical protein